MGMYVKRMRPFLCGNDGDQRILKGDCLSWILWPICFVVCWIGAENISHLVSNILLVLICGFVYNKFLVLLGFFTLK